MTRRLRVKAKVIVMGSLCAMRATNRVAALFEVMGDPENLKKDFEGRTVEITKVDYSNDNCYSVFGNLHLKYVNEAGATIECVVQVTLVEYVESGVLGCALDNYYDADTLIGGIDKLIADPAAHELDDADVAELRDEREAIKEMGYSVTVTLEQVLKKIKEWETSGAIGGDMSVTAQDGAYEAGEEGPLNGALNAISNLVDEANGLIRALSDLQEMER